jgi:hypothetical protein
MRIRWAPFRPRVAESDPATCPRVERSPDVVSAEHGNRTVLLDRRGEQYFALDGVGAAVWSLLARPATADEIATELALRYDAPEAEIRRDVVEFVDRLVADRLARRVP